MNAPPPCPLPELGIIAVRGVDARKFLNGQVSQDVLGLQPGRVELAGLHNPQGRLLALLRLVPFGPHDVLCVLPRALIADTVAGLRKFMLRAKVTVNDESSLWQLDGLPGDPLLEAATGSARAQEDCVQWRHCRDGRVLRLRPARSEVPVDAEAPADAEAVRAWQLADIAGGLPQIGPATRGEFVAQMLNLDVLGGISFNKGCYTGQEVIARAHYRGRVKRRLQRFRTASGVALAPAQRIQLATGPDGRSGVRSAQVVNVTGSTAGCEFLAVTAFGDAEAPEETAAAVTSATEVAVVSATALPMAYALPD